MQRRRFVITLGTFLSLFTTLLLAAGTFTYFTVGSPSVAVAQDDDSGGDSDEGEVSYLQWLGKALGLGFGLTFLALSFTLVALIIMNMLAARRDNICPVHLVEGFELQLNEKRYQEAYESAKNDDSFLGNVLSAGLAKLSVGYPQALEAMQEVGEEESMKFEHRLSYVALIGTLSPMVGLFGTVYGMIVSFKLLATPGVEPESWQLAEGISKALITTLLGLAIAIPAIAIYNILRNRIDKLVLEVGILSEGLMGRFEKPGQKKEGK